MAPRRSFAARLNKAVQHRLRRVRNSLGALRPAQRKQFASPSQLREFALSTLESTQHAAYTIRVPRGFILPRGPHLRLSSIRTVRISMRREELRVAVVTNAPVPEGRIAWACAEMIQPGLIPQSASSPDYQPAENAAPFSRNASAAAGQRLKFGDYVGTDDAVALEQSHALSLADIHPGRRGFDPFVFNPIGVNIRELMGRESCATTHLTADGHVIINGERFGWDEHTSAQFKTFASAQVSADGDVEASAVAALAATGVILTTESALPTALTEQLNPDLRALISQPWPPRSGSESTIGWLTRSAQQRRLALLHHALPWRAADEWPAVSVFLASNRPSMLPTALTRVLAQTYPNFEVHIALHGVADETFAENLRAQDPRVTVHTFDSGLSLGAVYGELTSRASGAYIAKMDDDDVYSPHHLWDLVLAARFSGAALIGKVPTLTWLADERELLLRSFGPEERYGLYVAGAAMLINANALLEVGGWRPSPWAEDKALIDRFADAGLVTYRTGQLGWAAVRHGAGHTWQRDHQHFRDLAETSWHGDTAEGLLNRALA